jgi:hypothetical protein
MIKIKVDAQMTSIFVQAPFKILDVLHSKMFANIDSINDKIVVEFYDVIEESAFNAATSNKDDTSNLRLLSMKVFDVRDLPFNEQG